VVKSLISNNFLTKMDATWWIFRNILSFRNKNDLISQVIPFSYAHIVPPRHEHTPKSWWWV